MIYKWQNIEIDYVFQSKNSDPVNIFLHGWGRSKEDFLGVIEKLGIENYLIFDFPPFGKSGAVKDFNIYSYAGLVMSLIDDLGIKRFNLICHSFGGRVGIIIAGREKERANKLVLVGCAGMKPKFNLLKKIKVLKYKAYKKMGLNVDKFGSSDYKNLSQDMKRTFVSVVTTFLEENAKLIEAKTLIIFGEKDCETPVYMAKKLHKLIPNSKLELIENAGHFCFLERPIKFSEILNEFLRGE